MFKKTLLMIIMLSSQAFAQTSGTDTSRGSDKLDIKKLEQKYWAAKDDDFSVVQNRKYVKAERFYFTGALGIPFNDPYSTGEILNGSIGYYFNERWGVELGYNSYSLRDNDAVGQFVNTYGVIPDHNLVKSSYFVSGTWVPFYAKMSVLDRSIIYFDMGISVGLGTIDYEITQAEGNKSENTFGYRLGIFQQIFFSEHFAIRADLINTWSDQKRMKYYAPGTTVGGVTVSGNRDLGTENINDTSLMIGITYWH
jgi:outer membrane beta-barrel protein